jgi:hypothetical protein
LPAAALPQSLRRSTRRSCRVISTSYSQIGSFTAFISCRPVSYTLLSDLTLWHQDPFQLLSNGSDSKTGGWKIQPDGTSLLVHQQYSSSRDPIRTNDPLTTFHYVYGTSLLFLGKILESHPFLAKDMEPVNSPAFYLAALDVLEDGENALHAAEGHKSLKEDWKLAMSLGMIFRAKWSLGEGS